MSKRLQSKARACCVSVPKKVRFRPEQHKRAYTASTSNSVCSTGCVGVYDMLLSALGSEPFVEVMGAGADIVNVRWHSSGAVIAQLQPICSIDVTSFPTINKAFESA